MYASIEFTALLQCNSGAASGQFCDTHSFACSAQPLMSAWLPNDTLWIFSTKTSGDIMQTEASTSMDFQAAVPQVMLGLLSFQDG